VIAVLSFFCISTVQAQKKVVSIQNYAAAEKKCDQSIDSEDWKVAESLCKKALAIANQLTDKNKAKKMWAFENYAFTLFSQSKFQLALDNYTKAFEIAKTFLTESDGDLAHVYFNLGRANLGLSKADKAVEYFQKSEQIYRAAFKKTTDSELKTEYKASIRKNLVLQRYIAESLNDEVKTKEIEKKLTDLEN
ncbi:MAG: tetratricopeptide repeat protein, partial [Actinomycetota bacterium]